MNTIKSASSLNKLSNQYASLIADLHDIQKEIGAVLADSHTNGFVINTELPNQVAQLTTLRKQMSEVALNVTASAYEQTKQEELERMRNEFDGTIAPRPVAQPKTFLGRKLAGGLAWLESKVA